MHAFILHLTRARARRENAHGLLDTCGLPGELWAAVDGRALDMGDLTPEVTTGLIEPPYPFALNPGEIGCFMSHRQIWAEILRRDLAYALILEDDVVLDPAGFGPALELASRHVAALGYVQLQTRPLKSKMQLVDQMGTAILGLPEIAPLRSSAQVISQAAARRLLDHADQIDRPVDAFIQAHWFTGLRPAAIYPSGVSTLQIAGSTIHQTQRGQLHRLRRALARWHYRRRVARLSLQSSASLIA